MSRYKQAEQAAYDFACDLAMSYRELVEELHSYGYAVIEDCNHYLLVTDVETGEYHEVHI